MSPREKLRSVDWEKSQKIQAEIVSFKSSSKQGTRGEEDNDLWRQNDDLKILRREFDDINNRNILNPKVHEHLHDWYYSQLY